MSILPSPEDFIQRLYQDFQTIPSDEDATVGQTLLEPLQRYIRDSGTQDASILNLERELTPLRDKSITQIKAPHQASDTEASAKIYRVFANSLSSSSSYTPAQKAAMSEEAISSFKIDLARANVVVSEAVKDKRAFQHSIEQDCGLSIFFAGESSEFSIRPTGSQDERVMQDMLRFELGRVETIRIGGHREIVPHFFLTDVLESHNTVTYSFPGSPQSTLTRSSAREFFSAAELFINANARGALPEEKLNLFRLLMLMNTSLVSNFFFGQLCSYFNALLSRSGNPLRADVKYDIKFEPFPGEPQAFVVRMEASLLILPDHLKTLSKHEMDRFFSEEGVENKLSIDFSICFEIGFIANALHFRCRENDGMIHCADPYSILDLTPEELTALQRNIRELQPALQDAFHQNLRDGLLSIPANSRSSMNADVPFEDWLTMDHALVSLPMPFVQDHLQHQRATTVRYSIGGASAITITRQVHAERLLENAESLASHISKNPAVQEVLLKQIFLCCSQQLANSVSSFFTNLLNFECLQRKPDFPTTIRVMEGDVSITQATGVFGRKDDEITVRYSFHIAICPNRGDPNPEAKSLEQALGIEKIISIEISGSFNIAAGKRADDVKIKDIKTEAKLV